VDGHEDDRGGKHEKSEAAPIPADGGAYARGALGMTGVVARCDAAS
jgi:hypothetical protein